MSLHDRLQGVFRDVFAAEDLVLDDDVSTDNTAGWDSLNHLSLMLAIEEEFGVRFDVGELEGVRDVRSIKRALTERLAPGTVGSDSRPSRAGFGTESVDGRPQAEHDGASRQPDPAERRAVPPPPPAGPAEATPLVLFGAGGYAQEVLDLLDAVNAARQRYRLVGVLTARPPSRAIRERDCPVLGSDAQLAEVDAEYLIAVGSPAVRRRLHGLASGLGRRSPALVHPEATVGAGVRLGPGALVMAGARVMSGVMLGSHCHLNLNATVGHGARLGDYVSVHPLAAVSGGVVINDGATIGAGSAVVQGLHVGPGSVVGAGSSVVRNVPAGTTVLGVPARAIRAEQDEVNNRGSQS